MKQLGILFIVLGVALFMWRSVEKSQEEDARIAQVVERHRAQKAQAAQVSLPESDADATGPSGASEKPWRYEGRYGKKRIKDIRLGDRVIARNPEVSESERMDFVDPDSSWKQVTLSMIKPDLTKVIVSLLRPQAWMAQQEAKLGGKIHLVLEELGLDGKAEVLAIGNAPEIKKGEGQVVTGTFHHQAGNVLDIAVEGLGDPIGTTSNHPFWSEDRQAFVQAGDLKVGEQLRQVDGSLTLVSSITNRGPPEKVFNLEVAGEHVYYVSDAGVLVHNSGPDYAKKLIANKNSDFSLTASRFRKQALDATNDGDALELALRAEVSDAGFNTFVPRIGRSENGLDLVAIRARKGGGHDIMIMEAKNVKGKVHTSSISALGVNKKATGVRNFEEMQRQILKRYDFPEATAILRQVKSGDFTTVLVGNSAKGTSFSRATLEIVRDSLRPISNNRRLPQVLNIDLQ